MPVKKDKGVLVASGISSGQVLSLLQKKHQNDVFVDECKSGPSWGAHLLKLDAWVLKTTYSPLTTIGYEIKVSRSDFEQDQKWVGYLDYCHEFYFVCPAGLIKSVDLPKEIGLIWTNLRGDKLTTKKRAIRKQPVMEKMNNLLIYVLMSRSVIVANMYKAQKGLTGKVDRLEVKKHLVEKAQEREALAEFINGHVREVYEQSKARCERAQSMEQWADEFSKRLDKLGFVWKPEKDGWSERIEISNKIDALRSHIDDKTINDMESIARRLSAAASELRGILDKS
jgi:hypothetical protein